ncbi:MAG: alternative ribosome rescue aminoacyl-tRNA hydrolase ArfB [Dehalococcoidia bacterium]|nr:alternative ribosome rescue aminoacyl-tRNA hydrolase ArfB [Dehalococcoidia bacterium]
MINITPSITIDEKEIQQEFIRSTGPGGQNVNKVATAVQLRFDVANSPSLPEEVRRRLFSLGKKRITVEGILIIEARRYRTQGANRLDAVERLVELIRKAAEKPRIRRKTRPTLASKERRLESKKRRGDTKRFRSPLPGPADL